MSQPSTSCVFVADDDEDDRYLLGRAFEQHGPECELLFAPDGLALLESMALSQSLPHLIILDLNMPRLNGFEVLKRLREQSRFQHIPVVVLTTSDTAHDRQMAAQLGAADFITKPLGVGLLGQIVRKLRMDWLVGKCC